MSETAKDFDSELSPAIISKGDGYSGEGWYVAYLEYQDEGSWFFDHEPSAEELRELGLYREGQT